jgi:hypothetical protein
LLFCWLSILLVVFIAYLASVMNKAPFTLSRTAKLFIGLKVLGVLIVLMSLSIGAVREHFYIIAQAAGVFATGFIGKQALGLHMNNPGGGNPGGGNPGG